MNGTTFRRTKAMTERLFMPLRRLFLDQARLRPARLRWLGLRCDWNGRGCGWVAEDVGAQLLEIEAPRLRNAVSLPLADGRPLDIAHPRDCERATECVDDFGIGHARIIGVPISVVNRLAYSRN